MKTEKAYFVSNSHIIGFFWMTFVYRGLWDIREFFLITHYFLTRDITHVFVNIALFWGMSGVQKQILFYKNLKTVRLQSKDTESMCLCLTDGVDTSSKENLQEATSIFPVEVPHISCQGYYHCQVKIEAVLSASAHFHTCVFRKVKHEKPGQVHFLQHDVQNPKFSHLTRRPRKKIKSRNDTDKWSQCLDWSTNNEFPRNSRNNTY